ncbi:MAG: hypothetical protein V1846_04325 [Candidatus Komeilibacteria bacterium]
MSDKKSEKTSTQPVMVADIAHRLQQALLKARVREAKNGYLHPVLRLLRAYQKKAQQPDNESSP